MKDPNETLTEIRGDLVLAALCVGQFHAPCQIEDDRLLTRADEGLLRALDALGLHCTPVKAVFTPAPLFAPEDEVLRQVAAQTSLRARRVATHVSRHADDDDDLDQGPKSNA